MKSGKPFGRNLCSIFGAESINHFKGLLSGHRHELEVLRPLMSRVHRV